MDRSTLTLAAVRAILRPLSLVAPSLVGRLAVRAFCRTPARRTSERIAALLSGGERATVMARGAAVAVWTWGRGPRVMLVHGWGGIGGQLATFVPALLERGYAVVTFDAPGHGASDGHESSLLHFADAIIAVHQSFGPTQAIVAHSLGAAATTLAMTRGLDAQAAVFLGPPSHPREWTEIFARRFGLTETAIDRMRHQAERDLDFRWDDIDTTTLANRLRVPLLIVHDVDDDEVPIAQGRELAEAWPGAQFIASSGLGHRRILSDPDVIDRSVTFLAEAMVETSASTR
jgi:pimeloyl-ACP methyl ester carboxylesterase